METVAVNFLYITMCIGCMIITGIMVKHRVREYNLHIWYLLATTTQFITGIMALFALATEFYWLPMPTAILYIVFLIRGKHASDELLRTQYTHLLRSPS